MNVEPTLVVPLDPLDVERKYRAIAAYKSQVAPGEFATLVADAGFSSALKARDGYWGAHAGVIAAEPFISARVVVDDDPVAWALAHPADHVPWFRGGDE
jgi:hypothetical protein